MKYEGWHNYCISWYKCFVLVLCGWPLKGPLFCNEMQVQTRYGMMILLGAGVLGDSLGTLADGVLGEFTGQE